MMGTSSWWEQVPAHKDLGLLLVTVLPVWAFGAVIGLLLPRPKWLEAGASSSTVFLTSPAGLFVRRLTILYHGAYLLREIWRFFTAPGSFQAVLTAPRSLLSAKGMGQSDKPHKRRRRHHKGTGRPSLDEARSVEPSEEVPLNWYVNEQDLEYFKDRVERNVELPGAGRWVHLMEKNFSSMKYSAWRRHLSDGKTDYKSITVAEDSTAEEFMDFYLDDDVRAQWDPMISKHEVLENGDGRHRCQVVRWIRSFPFSFIKEREYIIARRVWREDGCLYGITKCIEHPCAVQNSNIVRMDVFYSMWRSRTVPSPSGRPACETILLHREDFKIPENLARFAVKHGMANFVKKMGSAVPGFVQSRRERVDAFELDAKAYGVDTVPNPPSANMCRTMSTLSTASFMTSATGEDTEDASSECSTPRQPGPRRRRCRQEKAVRRFGYMLAATCVAVVLGGR